jgi:hypothetical protein
MCVPHLICDLADIRFSFSALAPQSFNSFFTPFFAQGGSLVDNCLIDVRGANSELCALRGEQTWNFSEHEGDACLTGANPDGDVLWRMTGRKPYERLSFEWHPTAFAKMYRSETRGPYGIVAILALVLRLLHLNGFVMHGSAQVVDGRAIICTGPSGRGKSTISRLFDRCGMPVLTDERPLLRLNQGRFTVYGSPWPSSGGFVLNRSEPLRKIYFIEHGPDNAIEAITRREAVLRLLDVAMVPWMDTAFFDPVIQTLEALIAAVPYAVLRFRPDLSVVDAVRRDLAAIPNLA